MRTIWPLWAIVPWSIKHFFHSIKLWRQTVKRYVHLNPRSRAVTLLLLFSRCWMRRWWRHPGKSSEAWTMIALTSASSPWTILNYLKLQWLVNEQRKVIDSILSRTWSGMLSLCRSLVSNRPQSLLSRLLKPSTPKPLANGVKFINRCVRDIDRLSDTFGQEWITLPNFVWN